MTSTYCVAHQIPWRKVLRNRLGSSVHRKADCEEIGERVCDLRNVARELVVDLGVDMCGGTGGAVNMGPTEEAERTAERAWRTEDGTGLTSHQSRVAVTGPQNAWAAERAFAVVLSAMGVGGELLEEEKKEKRGGSESETEDITQCRL